MAGGITPEIGKSYQRNGQNYTAHIPPGSVVIVEMVTNDRIAGRIDGTQIEVSIPRADFTTDYFV